MADSICFITGAHIDLTARTNATPVMGASNPGRVVARPGGAGLNAASTAAALGATTVIASPVGRDAHGQTLHKALAERGIGDCLREVEGGRTGTYTAIIAPDGSMVIGLADLAIYESVDAHWFLGHCGPALERARTWFFNANMPGQTLAQLAARANGKRIAAATISPAKAPRLAPVLRQVDFLFTNLSEARALTGLAKAPAGELVQALVAAGAGSGTLSCGPGPLHWWHHGQSGILLPPPAGQIVDVNGAGDALAATILVALDNGMAFETAARLGIAAAQLTLASPDPFYPGISWQLLEQKAAAPSPSI